MKQAWQVGHVDRFRDFRLHHRTDFQQRTKAPELENTSAKEAVCLTDTRNTSERVADGRHSVEVFQGGVGRSNCTISHGVCRDGKAPLRDVASWTALVSECTRGGQFRQALKFYKEMRGQGLKPNSFTLVAALKACSISQDMAFAKELHSDVVETGFDSHVYVATMLVDTYLKCGSLADAWQVFEKMPFRNVVSWNAMIMGYAQMEKGELALQLFVQMQAEGVAPNHRTFVGALKACSSLAASAEGNEGRSTGLRKQCLEQIQAIHSQVLNAGLQLDVFVGTMLVDAYAKCRSLVDARCVFERMTHRNVVCWTAMISGYSQMEEAEVALQLYGRMQQEGVAPNDRTFVGALKACSVLAGLEERGPGDGAYVKKKTLEQVKGIHSDIIRRRCELTGFVAPMLLDVYLKCGSLVDARLVFEKMPRRDVVAWTSMIMGHAKMEEGEIALELYSRMQQEGVAPDDRVFVGALKACSSLAGMEEGTKVDDGSRHAVSRWLDQVRAIHVEVVKRGSGSSLFVGNMLVDAYAKCGSLTDARCVFDNMPQRDVISWNALILAYAQLEEGEAALELYAGMQREGVAPDDRTFVGALKACSSLAASEGVDAAGTKVHCLEQVRALHTQLVEKEFETDVFVSTMLIDVYAKCGSLVDAKSVFEKLPNRSVACWNAMILGYAQIEEGEAGLELFTRMQQEGVVPNDRTFIGALKACGCVAGLEKGREVHAQMLKSADIDATGPFVASSLIDMYARCGNMVDAQQVFDSLPKRNVATWNALLAGYARQGEFGPVLDGFERARGEGMHPNGITFLCLLTACNHVGLVVQGEEYFESMGTDFGISPTLEHYSCMVDLLGRAGQVDKAMAMVRSMPIKPDRGVWRSLLGACQKWCKVELGRQAFESAVSLDRQDSAVYVLMANIYEAAHMVEDAKAVQAMRIKAQSWKQAGQSWWTDVSGNVHAFWVGDE